MELIARRRLQAIGGCLLVSLPITWMRDHGLKKGDVVALYLENGRLIIGVEKENKTHAVKTS